MTPREHSKSLRAVREAWEDGKEIEFNNKHDESGWLLYKGESPDWYNKAIEWRVKAMATYRQWELHEVPVGAIVQFIQQRCLILSAATYHDVAIGDAALTYSIGLELQKDNDALKDRIKRLEEEGDELFSLIKKKAKS
jgi:hypothetical protein